MPVLPEPESILMIAVIPDKRDLEIARLLGWYRIPLRRSPKIIEVDYLAFYQTGVFGHDHRWQIEYFSEYRGHELLRRKDLLKEDIDHPRANEEYFKVQIGPLQKLQKPILADRWKRITFFYTTGGCFNGAMRISDLILGSESRITLWRTLRERALSGGKYSPEEVPEILVDSDLLALFGSWLSPE